MAEFCGCCGRQTKRTDGEGLWCSRCQKHVLDAGPRTWGNVRYRPPQDRTYFAQHGRSCPYQVGVGVGAIQDDVR